MSSAFSLLAGLLPVVAFLLALIVLDSYKLVRLRTVLALTAVGVAVAVVCLALHARIGSFLDPVALRRYIAPVTEEALKAVAPLWMIRSHRVGFLVDAAICGFAVGAGFAALENLHYYVELSEPRLALWVVRGFGTAILHGGLTALAALVAKHLADRWGRPGISALVPGLVAAIVLHSFYNHFFLSPVVSTLLLLIVLPAVFAAVFTLSEHATRRWLGVGFDTDSELLELVESGRVSTTRIGEYLNSLRHRFSGETVVDMLCLIKLHLELSIQAKGLLLARQAGFEIEPDRETARETAERLAELRYLERTIGRTGLLALEPIFNVSSRDLWQIFLVERR